MMQFWKKLKAEKLQAFRKYHLKDGRQENLAMYFDFATLYKNKRWEEWTNGCVFLFPKKGDLRITNYRDIALCYSSKILFFPGVSDLKSRKFLGKIRMVFREISLQLNRFWQSIKSSKEYVQKILKHPHCL